MIFLGMNVFNEMAPRERKESFKVASPHKMTVMVVKVVQQPAKFGHIYSALTQKKEKGDCDLLAVT